MICSSNEKIFGKAETATRAIPGASKARKLIKRGLQYNASAKRKYLPRKDSDSSLKPLPKHQFTDTTTEASYVKEDDFEFVLDYRQKLVGKVNLDYVLTIQITFITKKHAIRYLHMHRRLQMPLSVLDPLSFLLNQLPKKPLLSPQKAVAWRVRFSIIVHYYMNSIT